jgi:hypothetical protein
MTLSSLVAEHRRHYVADLWLERLVARQPPTSGGKIERMIDAERPSCAVDGCTRLSWSRGMCHTHYEYNRRHGHPTPPSVEDRFWTSVDTSGECWLWTGSRQKNGYGRFSLKNRGRLAHRFAYELVVGPIPEGLEIDHLCRVRACVRPDHLEAVTRRVNSLRSTSFAAQNAKKTHCVRGHALEGENLYSRNGWRWCRQCRQENLDAFLARHPDYYKKRHQRGKVA